MSCLSSNFRLIYKYQLLCYSLYSSLFTWYLAIRTIFKITLNKNSIRASLEAQMVKNLPGSRRHGFDPWVGKIPWRREWRYTPVFWPGEYHGQKSLVGYSLWGRKESDMTEWLTHTYTHKNRIRKKSKTSGSISATKREVFAKLSGKEFACNAGDPTLTPGLGRSAGEGIGYPLQYSWAFLVAQLVKNPPAVWETWVQSLDWEDPPEKGKATHSGILAWRIPWTV